MLYKPLKLDWNSIMLIANNHYVQTKSALEEELFVLELFHQGVFLFKKVDLIKKYKWCVEFDQVTRTCVAS